MGSPQSPLGVSGRPVDRKQRPRLVMADDHTLVLEGFRRLLEPHFDLVGSFEDGRALIDSVESLRPDLVLLDISMPLLNGIDAARQLRRQLPQTKLIFLSMHADPAYVSEAFRAGASGYLLKRSAASELVFAIEEVLKGRFYVTPLVARDVVAGLRQRPEQGSRKAPPSPSGELTPRQREVLQLVAEGKAVKEIASILSISPKTVEFHKGRISEQLGLRTTAELTRYAIAHGIVSSV